ncbi:MAG: thermonuclease family protein [Ruegeria sp.]
MTGRATVIDGDTLEIAGQRIRLHGIDAPESGQFCRDSRNRKWRCGQKSALALDGRIGRAPVVCHLTGTDRYGRHIGTCLSGKTNLNGWLVRQGWAVAYRKYSSVYIRDEFIAADQGAGIWQGPFVWPADWRKGVRETVTRADGRNEDCAIKGNINRTGTRIYHLPGTKWYDRTHINASHGDR